MRGARAAVDGTVLVEEVHLAFAFARTPSIKLADFGGKDATAFRHKRREFDIKSGRLTAGDELEGSFAKLKVAQGGVG